MALSDSVKQSLEEAQSHIRNSLNYSSRQERPETCYQIAQILVALDRVIQYDASSDMIQDILNRYKS